MTNDYFVQKYYFTIISQFKVLNTKAGVLRILVSDMKTAK